MFNLLTLSRCHYRERPTRWLCVKRVEQRPAGLAFEAHEPVLEPCLGLAICGRRRDRPYLIRVTELGERFTRDRQRLSRLAGFMLIVDCQLLVSFVALARVSQCAFPKLARAGEVPVFVRGAWVACLPFQSSGPSSVTVASLPCSKSTLKTHPPFLKVKHRVINSEQTKTSRQRHFGSNIYSAYAVSSEEAIRQIAEE